MIHYNHPSCFGFRPLNFLFDVLNFVSSTDFVILACASSLALRRNVEDKSSGLLAYKAPVVILEELYLPNDCSVDAWSMGVLTLKYTLFGPWLLRTSEWSGRQYIKYSGFSSWSRLASSNWSRQCDVGIRPREASVGHGLFNKAFPCGRYTDGLGSTAISHESWFLTASKDYSECFKQSFASYFENSDQPRVEHANNWFPWSP